MRQQQPLPVSSRLSWYTSFEQSQTASQFLITYVSKLVFKQFASTNGLTTCRNARDGGCATLIPPTASRLPLALEHSLDTQVIRFPLAIYDTGDTVFHRNRSLSLSF
jgi:hypothetical protein